MLTQNCLDHTQNTPMKKKDMKYNIVTSVAKGCGLCLRFTLLQRVNVYGTFKWCQAKERDSFTFIKLHLSLNFIYFATKLRVISIY